MLGVESPAARLLTEAIPGPAGSLEALLRLPAGPVGAAVVAHPHPQHGGTLHTKVVHRAARLLSDRFRLASLRFNFRGVGASEGSYDGGPGETHDLIAAARWLRSRYPGGPLVVGGFSFGSVCALGAAPVLRPEVLLLVGLPLGMLSAGRDRTPGLAELEAGVSCPVVWLHGERDVHGDVAEARAVAGRNGWRLAVVPGADHFFTGQLAAFETRAAEALAPFLAAS